MMIQEIIRTCANDDVAQAAVASIGRCFFTEVAERAQAYDMGVGGFTGLAIERFLRHGDEGELRSVVAAMEGSQEPFLAGLHRILSIMLASDAGTQDRRRRDRQPRIVAQLCAAAVEARRDAYAR